MELVEKALPDLLKHLPQGEALQELKRYLVEARPPRIVLLGRRGSGKSSLVNALVGRPLLAVGSVRAQTGAGRWMALETGRGRLDLLDTRGLGEGAAPEAATQADARSEIFQSLRETPPDLCLFLCKAKEVDARIREDLRELEGLRQTVRLQHKRLPPVLGVLSQVDELDPVEVPPPYADPEKQRHIAQGCSLLEGHLRSLDAAVKVVPVSAYLRFQGEEVAADRRWNLDQLVGAIFDQLPPEAQVDFARLSGDRALQRRAAERLTRSAAAMAGLIGATPIPVADMPLITGLQVALVAGIARLSGRTLDEGLARAFLQSLGVNLGVAFSFREAARALVKLVPVAGEVISGGVAAAGTLAVGKAATAFFIRD